VRLLTLLKGGLDMNGKPIALAALSTVVLLAAGFGAARSDDRAN
jgi:hypothetical protein